MAVQAFTIVVRTVKLDLVGRRRCSKILNVDMPESAKLGVETAIEPIISMARIAGFVGWNSMILKMSGGDVLRIVHEEAPPIRLHDVARKTECRLLGPFDVFGGCSQCAQDRQNKKGQEREDFAAWRGRQGGSRNYDRD